MSDPYSAKPFVRILCLPDIDRPIGGVKQLYRHVEHLTSLGWDAAVVTQSEGFRPSWFTSTANTISLNRCFDLGQLTPLSTILVLPETYLNANLHSFYGFDLSAIPYVVFNQNAYYSYGDFSSSTHDLVRRFYGNPLALQILSVSEDTHSFLANNLAIPDHHLSRIINAVEPSFVPSSVKQKRLLWMPRKNPDHVQAVLHGLSNSVGDYNRGWIGEPLVDLPHVEVAKRLSTSKIFLSFGHPEGFGLPIAEAMSAGCWVVGYSGGGGHELFRYGASDEICFGDWPGFVSAVQRVLCRFVDQPREMERALSFQSLAIRSLYNLDNELRSISLAWDRIYSLFYSRQSP